MVYYDGQNIRYEDDPIKDTEIFIISDYKEYSKYIIVDGKLFTMHDKECLGGYLENDRKYDSWVVDSYMNKTYRKVELHSDNAVKYINVIFQETRTFLIYKKNDYIHIDVISEEITYNDDYHNKCVIKTFRLNNAKNATVLGNNVFVI